jgi:hypothetical protein
MNESRKVSRDSKEEKMLVDTKISIQTNEIKDWVHK